MPDRTRVIDPDAKKLAVMAAAETLFARDGYARTRISEIAREAGVAVGTVYRFFPDKPHLLAALHESMEERMVEALSEGWRTQGTHGERMEAALAALFDAIADAREVMPLYAMTRDILGATAFLPGAALMLAFSALYKEGRDAGAFHVADASTAAPILHGMIEGALRAWMMDPRPTRRARVFDDLVTFMHRALISP